MKGKILEAIQKGIQKSFNFEIDSDEGDFKITKSKVKSSSIDNWVYEQYQEKYKDLLEKKDYQGCLDLYNSEYLNQKPRAIGYKVESKEYLRKLVEKFNSVKYNYFNLNWVDVSEITDMSCLFENLYQFNCIISEWDVSNVTSMYKMFYFCTNFKTSLNEWDVSNVTDMHGMFKFCYAFNQQLNNWNVSNVINMNDMFYYCKIFNSNLSSWDVSNVEMMGSMFYNCINFVSNLSKWDVSNVKYFDFIFDGCYIKEEYKPKFNKNER